MPERVAARFSEILKEKGYPNSLDKAKVTIHKHPLTNEEIKNFDKIIDSVIASMPKSKKNRTFMAVPIEVEHPEKPKGKAIQYIFYNTIKDTNPFRPGNKL